MESISFESPNKQYLSQIVNDLGINLIPSKKIRKFILNAVVALSFLTGGNSSSAQGLSCVITRTNSTGVNIRSDSSLNGSILGSLSPQELADYNYSQHGWHLIEDEDGVQGWVFADLTAIKECDIARQIIEGSNDNSGVDLPFREYPEENLIIFGTPQYLTDEQIIELRRILRERINRYPANHCETTKPELIIFANTYQINQLQRQVSRTAYHSFSGVVDFDGTKLTASNGYCNNNSYSAAVINIGENLVFYRNEQYSEGNVTAHEIAHLEGAGHGVDNTMAPNMELDTDNAYYHGNVAGEAITDRCHLFTNEETREYCDELNEVFEQ